MTLILSSEPITLDELQNEIIALRKDYEKSKEDSDSVWISISTYLIFFMQAGFAMLELGTVRVKNAVNILIKNLLDFAMATIFWFIIGYGIAYGKNEGGIGNFIGMSNYGGGTDYFYGRDWLFQWAFAGTAATIVSGCLAERCYLRAYVTISIALTAFIYPIVVHWTWADGGWLKSIGFHDFAGSGVVHLLGGTCGIIGAYFLGARIGRFDPEFADDFRPHNTGFVTLGTMILWFGWYGFNGGSAVGATGDNSKTIQIVCMNTTLSGASSGLTVFLLTVLLEGVESVACLTNGLLAGLVSITGGCNVANSYYSIIIGIIAGCLYITSSRFVKQLEIDDPLDAFSVHGAGGLWGLLNTGLLHLVLEDSGYHVLFSNLLGALVIILWTSFWTILIFYPMKHLEMLRVPEDVELLGLDKVYHGGMGYYFGSNEVDYEEEEEAKI